MSIGVLVTLVFAILKLTHYVAWNWNQVFLPLYIELGFDGIVILLVALVVAVKSTK